VISKQSPARTTTPGWSSSDADDRILGGGWHGVPRLQVSCHRPSAISHADRHARAAGQPAPAPIQMGAGLCVTSCAERSSCQRNYSRARGE
jgi:hypothetical protein